MRGTPPTELYIHCIDDDEFPPIQDKSTNQTIIDCEDLNEITVYFFNKGKNKEPCPVPVTKVNGVFKITREGDCIKGGNNKLNPDVVIEVYSSLSTNYIEEYGDSYEFELHTSCSRNLFIGQLLPTDPQPMSLSYSLEFNSTFQVVGACFQEGKKGNKTCHGNIGNGKEWPQCGGEEDGTFCAPPDPGEPNDTDAPTSTPTSPPTSTPTTVSNMMRRLSLESKFIC